MHACFLSSQNKPKPRQLESTSNMISQLLKTLEPCPKGWSFPSQGVIPKLELKLPTVRAPLWKLESDYSILWEYVGVSGPLHLRPMCYSSLQSASNCQILKTGVVQGSLLFWSYPMLCTSQRTFLWNKFNVSYFYKFDNSKTQRNVGKFQQRRHKQTPTSMHSGACVSQSVESDSL